MTNALAVVDMTGDAPIEQKAPSVSERATGIKVVDRSTYEIAALFLRDELVPMIDEVKATFDPICKAASDAHQKATHTRSRYLDPLEDARKSISAQIGVYALEQKRLEDERQALAQKEAERRHLEALEVEIEQAEAEGATADEIKEICNQPLVMHRVPAPTLQVAIPRISTRQTYQAQVVDLKALARAVADGKVPSTYLLPNMPALNQAARSQGIEISRYVPGVKAVTVSSVSARRAN